MSQFPVKIAVMNNVMGMSLLGTLYLSSMVHAAVTKQYRVSFRARFELDAEAVKNETISLMPGLFARQLCDVEWNIEKESKDFVILRLTGISRSRIEAWLHVLQSQTRNAVAEVRDA